MADEELDAGLVERLRDALPGTCRKERCRPPLNSGVRCPCADPVLRILGALPIPAAALNALAKGDADVVPKVRTREMLDARQMVHGFAPLTDARWQDIESCRSGDAYGTDAATLIDEEWSAMLAASPYRSEP